jgi:hypothetical protein
MWTLFIVIALLMISAGGIYLLLRNMGQNGIEAAAPGSCRSGRCGVTPNHVQTQGSPAESMTVQLVKIDEITRKDAASPHQTL